MKTVQEFITITGLFLNIIFIQLLVWLGFREKEKYQRGLIIQDRIYPPRRYSDEKHAELTRLAVQYEREFIIQMREHILTNHNAGLGILALIRFESDEALETLAEILSVSPKNVRQEIVSRLDSENCVKGIGLLETIIQTDNDAKLREYAKQVATRLRATTV